MSNVPVIEILACSYLVFLGHRMYQQRELGRLGRMTGVLVMIYALIAAYGVIRR